MKETSSILINGEYTIITLTTSEYHIWTPHLVEFLDTYADAKITIHDNL